MLLNINLSITTYPLTSLCLLFQLFNILNLEIFIFVISIDLLYFIFLVLIEHFHFSF